MSYALVEDVPASWEHYGAFARSVGQVPPGLLLHVAGPTDEGFRIIEVWESEAAWLRFSAEHAVALASVDPAVSARTVVRDLRAVHVVAGEAWPDLVRADWIAVGPGNNDGSPGPESAAVGPGMDSGRGEV
jgi:hypothetical protein